ncbi:hypothetical protein [Ruegeria jejuensis]|uniref:hypothetical protein n=1 Tax=Ruegeria jejuensis TaxID=3233338 RepID=UPI00355B0E39
MNGDRLLTAITLLSGHEFCCGPHIQNPKIAGKRYLGSFAIVSVVAQTWTGCGSGILNLGENLAKILTRRVTPFINIDVA